MKKLPLELHRLILDDVCATSSRSDIFQLRTTCKAFEASVTEFAFRLLRFTSSLEDTTRLENLLRSAPRAVKLVHDLEVEIVDAEDDPNDMTDSRLRRLSSGLESHADTDPFTRLPHKFPSLKTIKLTYSDEVPTPYDFPLLSSDYVYKQLYTLEAIVREAHITKLTSLTIINFIALPPDFQRSESFANSLAKLAHLEVVFCAEIPGSTPIAEWSYDVLFPKESMQCRYCGSHPGAPWAITHLTLGSEDEQGNLVPLDYSTLKFPHLSSLTLRGLSFRDLPDEQEAFILRHADTIRSLTLVDCLTLRLERFPIWERLASELTQLVDISVQSDMDPDSPVYSMYGFDDGERIQSVEDDLQEDPETAEKDKRAFERFLQIVDDRRKSELCT